MSPALRATSKTPDTNYFRKLFSSKYDEIWKFQVYDVIMAAILDFRHFEYDNQMDNVTSNTGYPQNPGYELFP